MSPQNTSSTAAGYDLIAAAYAEHLYRELDAKPFDREFLDRFARTVPSGNVLDLGCGPGHVGTYLHRQGVPILGLDISAEMVRLARDLNPALEFEQGDMRSLPFPEEAFAGVVAFYSIIHLDPSELAPVFAEILRVLQPGGLLALSFHVGTEVRHIEELWGVKTGLDFVFFEPTQVEGALRAAGFEDLESSQRGPYEPAVEAQTHRCYILARRPGGVSFDLSEALEILERTPAVIGALLRGTSASWHDFKKDADTWSAVDVVGHLIHGEETDWVPRARIILEHGEAQAFEPFDRFAQLTRFAGWSLDALLDRFAELRQANLETVTSWRLTEDQLDLKGRHPELGLVILRELLATWAVHDLNHLAQISRILAQRYTRDVGAWKTYLSILNRS
jgi:SAM-dependent methyltransferase